MRKVYSLSTVCGSRGGELYARFARGEEEGGCGLRFLGCERENHPSFSPPSSPSLFSSLTTPGRCAATKSSIDPCRKRSTFSLILLSSQSHHFSLIPSFSTISINRDDAVTTASFPAREARIQAPLLLCTRYQQTRGEGEGSGCYYIVGGLQGEEQVCALRARGKKKVAALLHRLWFLGERAVCALGARGRSCMRASRAGKAKVVGRDRVFGVS